MDDTEHAAGPIDSLMADFRLSIKRLKETPLKTIKEVNQELQLNVYPSMMATLEQILEIDDVVEEMVNHQGSYIQQELAAQIFHTVALGGGLAEEIRHIISSMDDMSRKRMEDMLADFEHSMELTIMGVSNATVEPGDEDDDENEDTSPGKHEFDDQKTPLEIPRPLPPTPETDKE